MPENPLRPPDEISPEAEGRMEAFFFAHARSGACPPLELLFAAEEDVLPSPAAPTIRAHLAACSLCQTILAQLHPVHAVLTPAADARIRDRIQSHTAAPSSLVSSATQRSLFAIAAVVVLGILGIFSYRLLRPSAGERLALAPAHAAPADRTLADLAELHHVAPLAPPDDVPALVLRGPSTDRSPTVHDLMPAFRAYNRDDFAAAASALAPLVQRFPQSRIPPLYLGVSQLELAENADAQRSLEHAYGLTGPSHDAAAWYLAIADLRLDQPKAATPLLRDLCTRDHSFYTVRACTLARKIGPS